MAKSSHPEDTAKAAPSAPGVFSSELQKQIEGLLVRFETRRSSILPILHAIQDEQDWISDGDIETLERDYGLSAVDVREVLTFYTMYRTTPPKPWRLEVCNSISCWLMGSARTLAAAEQHLKEAKASGSDVPFSCREVECLGYCGRGPVAFVNKERHLDVTADRALELIRDYSSKPLPPAAKRCSELLQQSEKKG